MICWKCGKEINITGVFRDTECPLCKADLHSCKGCKFFSKGSHFDCRETVEDLVSDKERANFCEYFSANNQIKTDVQKNQSDAKDAFNALFGD